MEIKNHDRQDTGLKTTAELNLYLDLLAFSELSTEEKIAYKERLKVVNSEEILEAAGEFPGFVDAAEPVIEQPSTVEAANEDLESEDTEPPAASVAPGDLFKASGPLSITGFLFDPTSKAAPQAMSLAVCASCGSETDGEDLFCVECGAFMDEKSYIEVTGSACDDCGLTVTTGELICPACGSVSVVC